jgi:hypothetical protein
MADMGDDSGNEETQSAFIKESSVIEEEIRGLILGVNDAATVAECEIASPKEYPRDVKEMYYNIKMFYQYMGRLIKNSEEILQSEKPELYERLLYWWHYKKISDFNHFYRGLELSRELQSLMFNIGIKDTNKQKNSRFPFKYFKKMMDQKDKEMEMEATGQNA